MTMSVVTSVSTVGSKKLPPCAARLPPVTTLAPFLTASAMCASTFSTAFMAISGRITCLECQCLRPRIAVLPLNHFCHDSEMVSDLIERLLFFFDHMHHCGSRREELRSKGTPQGLSISVEISNRSLPTAEPNVVTNRPRSQKCVAPSPLIPYHNARAAIASLLPSAA